jgi:hypothetical protein
MTAPCVPRHEFRIGRWQLKSDNKSTFQPRRDVYIPCKHFRGRVPSPRHYVIANMLICCRYGYASVGTHFFVIEVGRLGGCIPPFDFGFFIAYVAVTAAASSGVVDMELASLLEPCRCQLLIRLRLCTYASALWIPISPFKLFSNPYMSLVSYILTTVVHHIPQAELLKVAWPELTDFWSRCCT